MKKRVPTLTTSGWIEDPAAKLRTLFEYSISSQKSQTFFYGDNITSLHSLIQQYGTRPSLLEDNVQARYQSYLSRYFDEVMVSTRITHEDSVTGRYNLELNIVAVENGREYSLGRVLEAEKTRLVKIYDESYLPREIKR
mgnify:CR=1 FL=1